MLEVRTPQKAEKGGAAEIARGMSVFRLVKPVFLGSTEGRRNRIAQKAEYSDRRIYELRLLSSKLQNLQIPALLFDSQPLDGVVGSIGNISHSINEGENTAVETTYRLVMEAVQKKQTELENATKDLMTAASLHDLRQKIEKLVQGHKDIDSSIVTIVINELETIFSDINSNSESFVLVADNRVRKKESLPPSIHEKVSQRVQVGIAQQKKVPDWLDQAVLQAISRNYFESTIVKPDLSLQELLNILLNVGNFLIEPGTTAQAVYNKLAAAINNSEQISSDAYPEAIKAAIDTALSNIPASSTEAVPTAEVAASAAHWSDDQITTFLQGQILDEMQRNDMIAGESATRNAFRDQRKCVLSDSGQITIGRNLVNEEQLSMVAIPNKFVSRTPAVLMRTRNNYSITAKKSAVHVNGVLVRNNQSQSLRNGDVLLFGGVTGEAFVFNADPVENTVSLELHQPFYRLRGQTLSATPETQPNSEPRQKQANLSELLNGNSKLTLDSKLINDRLVKNAQDVIQIQFGTIGWRKSIFRSEFGVNVATIGTITLSRAKKSELLQKGFKELELDDVLEVGDFPTTVQITIDTIPSNS